MSHDIFLSYATEDVSRASELARVLENEGWSIWWDRQIIPGQDFETEIDQAISDARAVMVLWSVFSVASNWVRNEASEAKELNKLIPVKLDDVKVPLSFRALNTIELIDWPQSKSVLGLSMLKSSLRKVLKSGVSSNLLKKPNTDDEMTLSVRVASRVADLVRAGGPMNQISNDIERQFEKCITDICLDIVTLDADKRQDYAPLAVEKLGHSLSADYTVTGTLEPNTAKLQDLCRPDELSLPDGVSSKVTNYISTLFKEHGSEAFSNPDTLRGESCDLLFLYESRKDSDQRVTCFVSNTQKWSLEFQRRLTQLSLALFSP